MTRIPVTSPVNRKGSVKINPDKRHALPPLAWGVDFRNGSLPASMSFVRASQASFVNASGVLTTAANHAPRFARDANLRITGLLMEETRTNHLLNSGSPVTQTVSLNAGTYTLWLEGSGSCTAAAGTATGSGFGSANATTPRTLTITVSGTVSFTVSGSVTRYQCENGAFKTSYIATTGAAATRAGEICSMAGGGWLDASQGTIYVEYMSSVAGIGGFMSQLEGTPINDRIAILRQTNDDCDLYVSVGGTPRVQLRTTRKLVLGRMMRHAIVYKAGNFAAAMDNAAVARNSANYLPVVGTAYIGCRSNGSQFNGVIGTWCYYNTTLTDDQLLALTT